MREIKFRGQRTDNDKWVYGYYFVATARQLGHNVPLASARLCHSILDEDGVKWDIHPKSVGQFTGLCDKQNVDIYEGDIVICTIWETLADENGSEEREGRATAQVKYLEDDARYYLYDMEGNWISETTEPWTEDFDIEVVGNVYENKELLE